MNHMVDYLRHLVLPQRLQHTLLSRVYPTRASEKSPSLGKLKGFVDLPVDIALEVSINSVNKQ